MIRYLNGEDMKAGREKPDIPQQDFNAIPKKAKKTVREHMARIPMDQRKSGFTEVELGFTEEQAKQEANKCVDCMVCCECLECVKACGAGALTKDTHVEQNREVALKVGSVVISSGFSPYNPTKLDFYGFENHPNVVTSLQFERLLSASGPTEGHVVRPSDHKEPKKIAWFQCVGSREHNRCDNDYCSSVCCMYAIKEAAIAKEHDPELDASIFYMDMRTFGKDFEKYYNEAKDKHGVNFIRSRVHTIKPVGDSGDLEIRYVKEDGELVVDTFDMIVLSVGLETSPELKRLADQFNINLTKGNFAETATMNPVETSTPGVFVCGAFQGPKDIPQAVVDSSAAATAAGEILASARNTLTKTREIVPERNVTGERPRIGAFICHCGINIAGVVDVQAVNEYVSSLPYVEYVTNNLYSCSQDTQASMTEIIKEHNLNRIIVAACTPKTHEPLFQETLINAGLNKYLFEMVNIRNHASWVHKANPDLATEKAKELIRMAVAKIGLKAPLKEARLDVNQNALVVGGGIAGMSTALSLARQGYKTHLIEKEDKLGGQAHNLYKTWKGENIQEMLADIMQQVNAEDNIDVHLNSKVSHVDGFIGNFSTTVSSKEGEHVIEHGVATIATGATEHKPAEYCYDDSPNVVTSLEFDHKMLANDPQLESIDCAVFIQCVGSREPDRPYCSRVCCTHSVENALELKKRNPDARVMILYRDIRTYGERERKYIEARKAGVIFMRYSVDNKPTVSVKGGKVTILTTDHVLGRAVEIEADLLTLASAIIPRKEEQLAQFFKVPMNAEDFFIERHAKLGPSEFATDGVFLSGLAHYPKPIDESVAQGKAAASRAVTLLAQGTVTTNGEVASIDQTICSNCGICVSVCPYSAPSFIEEGRFAGKSEINSALCKGCGLCVSSCRSGAIHLNGYDNDQIFAMIDVA
jgi:heterodisulfide reductase subunit A-like polyferredoxin